MVNGIRRFIRRNVLVMCQFRLIFKGFPEVSRKWMQSKLCGLEVHSFVVHILLYILLSYIFSCKFFCRDIQVATFKSRFATLNSRCRRKWNYKALRCTSRSVSVGVYQRSGINRIMSRPSCQGSTARISTLHRMYLYKNTWENMALFPPVPSVHRTAVHGGSSRFHVRFPGRQQKTRPHRLVGLEIWQTS